MRTRELRKRGLRMHLRGKSFEVLAALLEHSGGVVTREELRRRLWPEGIFVDFENSLNSTVNRLRAVLGDSPTKPKFIETLPKLGYRCVAPVEALPGAPPPSRCCLSRT
ncbi:MAG: winged helix-turn-helix domain-containing protein [Acidobacteria bacterium]|nr:winged helix-turn-helix domain-containing protein [Acidobacteriota bacterium]